MSGNRESAKARTPVGKPCVGKLGGVRVRRLERAEEPITPATGQLAFHRFCDEATTVALEPEFDRQSQPHALLDGRAGCLGVRYEVVGYREGG
jgi:hypothetical protein